MKQDISTSVWSSFFGHNPDIISSLQASATLLEFNPKECILSQQDKSRDVYYMLKGKAKAVSISVEGQEVWLETIEPGSLFGEVSALGNGDRSATVIAKTKAQVAKFKGPDFLNLMEKHGSIGIAVSKLLVTRINRTTRRMCELSSLSAPGRIYAELLRLAEYDLEDKPNSCCIKIIPPNTEIATLVNSTRETVSRTLSELENDGLIERKGAKVIICSPDLLMDKIQ